MGLHEPNHTAQQHLFPLLQQTDKNPTLNELEEAYSIEKVTKEFFERYKVLFLTLKDELDKIIDKDAIINQEFETKNIDTIAFAKKLLGQIVFLYFLQKKGWLGVPKNEIWGKGDKRFLRTLFNKCIKNGANYYNDYMEYLFYEALAIEKRGTPDPSYYKRFDCKIPFLNGGLFEPINDYDWVKTNINLPNTLFSNNTKTVAGDIGTGILDVFDRYNFTVKEDDPLEREVAVDPEMLGKVFENLLEVKDRKSKGAFYTPREIVQYMCHESLINYLDTCLNYKDKTYQKIGDNQRDMFGDEGKTGQLDIMISDKGQNGIPLKDIETFIKQGYFALDHDSKIEAKGKETRDYKYLISDTIRNNAKTIDKALSDVKICDPAIGSGAFPVGLMNEIVKARLVLNTYIKDTDCTAYDFKRHAIQESIYGVDIDSSAIDIAKLRLWLSLVVDEESIEDIEPLPNLDYKIICGNSLLSLPQTAMKNIQEEKKLEQLKEKYFSETDISIKGKIKSEINSKIRILMDSAKMLDSKLDNVDFDFRLFFSEIFHQKKGFDIIIGNPPYINIKNQEQTLKEYIKRNYKYSKGADIYLAFVERSLNTLTELGLLVFIIPNKFFGADYGKPLRAYLKDGGNVQIPVIWDLKDEKVFKSSLISTIVIGFKKSKIKINTKLIQNGKKIIKENLFDDYGKIQIEADDKATKLIQKLNKNKKLNFYAKIRTGVMGFEYWKMQSIIKSGYTINKGNVKLYTNGNFSRYTNLWKESRIKLYKDTYTKPTIELNSDFLNNKTIKLFITKPKILVRGVSKKVAGIIDDDGSGILVAVHSIIPKHTNEINYLLAIINSKLINWYHLKTIYSIRIPQGSLKYPVSFFDTIPVAYTVEQKNINNLVDKIIETKKQNVEADTTQLETQIDLMVYKLYELTYEEVKVVDQGFGMSEGEYEKFEIK